MFGTPPPAGAPTVSTAADAARRLRVLLVEDDDGDALLVEEMLIDAAFPVRLDRARTVAEALDRLSGVDCVLLDLQLPDAAGMTGLERLREQGSSAAVVVLTGQADEQNGMAAVAAGAQDYLVKGQVDGALLARALRYSWERRRAEEVQRLLREQRLLARENSRLERGLLPTPLLTDPTLEFTARYRPGRNGTLLGGDFYDAVELPDGSVHLMIGDVCGHGPDEAALGVSLRIAWRSLVLAGLPAEQVLATAQQVLEHERTEDRIFATLCMVSIAPDRTALRMHLAGHPVPLLIDQRGARLLTAERVGVPLGVLAEARWQPVDVPLSPDWALLLCTDGVFEGRVGDGPERLGHERLADLVVRLLERTPEWRTQQGRVLDALIEEVERLNDGRLDDDHATLILTHTRPARG